MIVLENTKTLVTDTKTVVKIFRDLLSTEDSIDQEKEHFFIMHLDARNRISMVELIALGSINATITHPREVFRRAITAGSVSIIVGHNHPSGNPEPSDTDIRTTEQLHKAGEILEIPLIDHIIFAKESFYSFRENN